MARTKQTACKSDSKGKLTQATFEQPSTEPDSTITMDRPDKPKQAPVDIDPNQAKSSVDPEVTEQANTQPPTKAGEGEEDIVELGEGAEGDIEDKASPSTSSDTPATSMAHKCKHDKEDEEESRSYMAQSCAAAEAWKKAVTNADNKVVAKAAYSTLYNALHQQVLVKQPSFNQALKSSRMVST